MSVPPGTEERDASRATLLVASLAPVFVAVGFLQVVISVWYLTIGFSALQIGLLITTQSGFVIASSIPLGIASDVYGRKRILLAGTLAGSVGLVWFALTTDFVQLLVASGVLGFAEGATLATWNALLADLTEPRDRNRIFSLSFMMITIATGVGLVLPGVFPLLEPALGATSNSLHETTLLLLSLASFASPVAVFAILREHAETLNPGRKFSGFKNMGTLAKIGFVGSAIGFGAGFIIPLVGTWFTLRYGVTDAYSGPVLAVSNILIGAAAIASPRLASRVGQLNAIMVTTGASMVFMFSMAFIPIVNLAAGVYIVRSGLMNMASPLMDSFTMSIFPTEQRGLVSAVSNTLFRLPNSVSTSIGGYLLGVGLLQLPFFIASGLYAVGLGAFFVFFVASKKYSTLIST